MLKKLSSGKALVKILFILQSIASIGVLYSVNTDQSWVASIHFNAVAVISITLFNLITAILIYLLKDKTFLQRLILFFTPTSFLFWSSVYLARLNDTQVGFLSLTILSLAILTISSIIISHSSTVRGRFQFLPKAIYTIVATLASFSFFEFVSANYLSKANFFNNLFEYLSAITPPVWLTLSAISVSIVSIGFNNLERVSRLNLVRFATLILTIFTAFIFTYFLSISDFGFGRLTYWYLSLIVFIIWDFVYMPLQAEFENNTEGLAERLRARSIYHYTLIFLVIAHEPIFELITKLISR